MTLTHPTILGSRLLHWPDEAACAAFAARLASCPEIRDAVLELRGPLGAGKTTLVRHLLRALGVTGRVKSPTYTVMESYALPGREGVAVAHFDFYRFADPHEWVDAGLRDAYAAPGLKIAEWPDKAGELLPAPDLRIAIDLAPDDGREVELQAGTPRGLALLGAAS